MPEFITSSQDSEVDRTKFSQLSLSLKISVVLAWIAGIYSIFTILFLLFFYFTVYRVLGNLQ